MNDVAGQKLPSQRAGSSVERIDVVVAAADIGDSVGDCRRRQKTSKGSGIISFFGLMP